MNDCKMFSTMMKVFGGVMISYAIACAVLVLLLGAAK